MILDASAIVRVLLREEGFEILVTRIADAAIVAVGAPTLVEAAIVLAHRLRKDPRALLDQFIREAEIEVIPLSADHFDVAVNAFLRYGKGRHPAGLNFGDCLTYAIARVSGLPLLFTGDDFAKTDLG